MTEAEKAYQYFVIAVPENEEQAKAYFWARKALQTTLTQPNEPLTLIRMNEELPPDNERVLVYRPCMETADTGPWDVQWGWSAKRDGSHWAHLNRRPPEGEKK